MPEIEKQQLHVVLVGLSHKTASLEIRERVSFSSQQLPNALASLSTRLEGGVILSTCNRTEIYTVSATPEIASTEIQEFLREFHNIDVNHISQYLYEQFDRNAVRHLFNVASGLDSMILGESEILGQIRNALTVAANNNTLDTFLSRLFHRAIRTGRQVRTNTQIGHNPTSTSSAAVKLTQQILGPLKGVTVMLVGAGEAGRLVAKALVSTGVEEIIIANRTHNRSVELAQSLGGKTITLDDSVGYLNKSDVVIVATESQRHIYSQNDIENAAKSRNRRPLFVFDLSVPRNVEPGAGSVDNVNLFNIDDLSSIAKANIEARQDYLEDAQSIIDEAVQSFLIWWDSLESMPIIKALRQQAELIRKEELKRAMENIPALSTTELNIIDSMTQSIVNRLLHNPTVSLKQSDQTDALKLAQDLFRLDKNNL